MTSEAGGAVAFPVMTFALKASPTDGRDFSLLIQSFGELFGGEILIVFLN